MGLIIADLIRTTHSLTPTFILYLIWHFEKQRRGGQHDLAMELLSSMLRAGLSPDDITVAELVSSLSDRGKWDEAIQALEIATRTGAIPVSLLDGDFEVDVSHLPSAIAKVKVRQESPEIVWR